MISEKGLERLHHNGVFETNTLLSVKDIITYLQKNVSYADMTIEDIPIAIRVTTKGKSKIFVARENANPFKWLLRGPTFIVNMTETDFQDMECLKQTNKSLAKRVKELEEKLLRIKQNLE